MIFSSLPVVRSCTLSGIAILLLSACSTPNISIWPFGGDKTVERSRIPANATEYQCAAGKRFYVRQLDGGNSVWLILAEREVRLDKSGAAMRYSNGIAVLELNGAEAKLTDGTLTYTGCKVPEIK